jgi:Histidine kinase-, DNA gyrase B-, and HSP90-like ATPase
MFVNALKYTDDGFVRVTLYTDTADTVRNGGTDTTLVRLEIKDSGIGMTQDFLAHQLYTPFIQANPLSVGTGLGLSIVRQLVTDLEGYIDVESDIGHGTSIKVSIPLKVPEADVPHRNLVGESATIRDIGVWSKGLILCIVGFDYDPKTDKASTSIISVYARRMLALRKSIVALADEWFGMKTTAATSIADARGHILIGMQSQIDQAEMKSRTKPLIVLEDMFRESRLGHSEGTFHLSQP